jgi:hypothetical protein
VRAAEILVSTNRSDRAKPDITAALFRRHRDVVRALDRERPVAKSTAAQDSIDRVGEGTGVRRRGRGG